MSEVMKDKLNAKGISFFYLSLIKIEIGLNSLKNTKTQLITTKTFFIKLDETTKSQVPNLSHK